MKIMMIRVQVVWGGDGARGVLLYMLNTEADRRRHRCQPRSARTRRPASMLLCRRFRDIYSVVTLWVNMNYEQYIE